MRLEHIGNATVEALDHAVGPRVDWVIYDRSDEQEHDVCRYAAIVRAGKISANLPNRYLLCLNKKDFVIRIEEQARSTPLK